MKIALDLGTKTGAASVMSDGTTRVSNSIDLSERKHENRWARFSRLTTLLDSFAAIEPVEGVWYEAVRAHRGTDAAHAYGGFLATVQTWCDQHEVPCVGVPVQTIKKHATGKGNASKMEVIIAVGDRFGMLPVDDNEADALALLWWVMEGEAK